MKNKTYGIAGFIIAIMFWFSDASIHYFVYGEPEFEFIPRDFNELWMRIVIVSLIVLFGLYADYSTKKQLINERRLEAARIYNSMIHASHHILNNLLNQMQLFKYEAQHCNNFDREILKLYDDAFDEAKDLIRRLSEVEHITDDNIWASIAPGNRPDTPAENMSANN